MTLDQFKKLYPLLRDIALGKTPRPAGLERLEKNHGMNPNSAISSVNNLRHMISGTTYQRKMPIAMTEYILEMFQKELAVSKLHNAINAVKLHLVYYEEVSGNKQPSIQKVVERFEGTMDANDPTVLKELKKARETADAEGDDTDDGKDGRTWVLRLIAKRQGQSPFRNKLLRLYRRRCSISGCSIQYVLEAAHIKGYKGPKTNHSSNGLLLRTDLHTLFDLHLISIDTTTWTVLVSKTLMKSSYHKFAGKKLTLPKCKKRWPSVKRLDWHRKESKL